LRNFKNELLKEFIMKKIAILGTGSVGQTYASKFISLGYEVMMGTRDVARKLASNEKDSYGNPSFQEWYSDNKKVKMGTFREAVAFGDIILNATRGVNSISILRQTDINDLKGKILMDIANPLDYTNGMPPAIQPELNNTNSLGEEIQNEFPDVKVVKALNTMWAGLMVNPTMLNGGDHNAFICGNDTAAKMEVIQILKSFGWSEKNILDLGDITSARGTEMYLPLWLRIFRATNSGAFNIKIVKLD
jgi:8-hydroxy-5-deazaflavin:NADPH oxidoreductase